MTTGQADAKRVRSRSYSALMQAPAGIAILVGAECRIDLANPLYLRIVGREGIVGQRYREAFPAATGRPSPEALERVFVTGEPLVTEALAFELAGNPQTCWFEFRVEALREGSAPIDRLMVVAVDVTDQVRSRQREEAARAEAERAVKLNEIFVGILGHDLRDPMSAISMAASLLLRKVTAEDERKAAQRIVSSSDRMARMIDQLLDFTRIRHHGGLAITGEQVDLAELCGQLVEDLQASHPSCKLTLEVSGADAHGSWDADRLIQALTNLLGNAIEHGTSGGEVAVKVESSPQRVWVSIHNHGQVPEALVPVLFDPFHRSEARGRRGLGLGLFITQQIAGAHGGVTTVTSTANGGTTFTLELPRTPPKNAPVIQAEIHSNRQPG